MSKKIIFLFPGQGTQKIGMGKDIYDSYQSCKDLFCNIKEWIGVDIEKLLFVDNDDINKTQYTQIAILSLELAILRILKEHNIKPFLLAGYSLGEYAALVASGAITEKDAITLIKERGRLMAETVPNGVGGMAAVIGMPVDKIREIISAFKSCEIVNYNTPTQVSIAGLKEEVEKAGALLSENGARRVVMLNVSGPFHSALLHKASDYFSPFVDKCSINDIAVPYFSNVDAKENKDKAKIKELLCKQISSPVLWNQSMDAMLREKVDAVVEVGYGNVLRGFLRSFDTEGISQYGTSTVAEIEKIFNELE